MDSTNFSVTALTMECDEPDATILQGNGYAKEGDNSKLVYNPQSVTDQNEAVCFERLYDGTISDTEMDRDTMGFLATSVDHSGSTLVANSEIVAAGLIELLFA